MFLAIHAATGVALAQQTESAAIAFTLGLVSHYVLDAIPHGDEFLEAWHRDGKKKLYMPIITLDFFTMFVYVLFLFSSGTLDNPMITAWAVLGAVIPDFIQAYYLVTKKHFKRLCAFHNINHNAIGRWLLPKITKKDCLSPKLGLALQAVFLFAVLVAF